MMKQYHLQVEREQADCISELLASSTEFFRNKLSSDQSADFLVAAAYQTATAMFAELYPPHDPSSSCTNETEPHHSKFHHCLSKACELLNLSPLLCTLVQEFVEISSYSRASAVLRCALSDVVEGVNLEDLRYTTMSTYETLQTEMQRTLLQGYRQINAQVLREYNYAVEDLFVDTDACVAHKILFNAVLRGKGNRRNYGINGSCVPFLRFGVDGTFDVCYTVTANTVEPDARPRKSAKQLIGSKKHICEAVSLSYVIGSNTFVDKGDAQ